MKKPVINWGSRIKIRRIVASKVWNTDLYCRGEKRASILAKCSFRNNPYPPHGRSLEIPRGRGVLKVKILEATHEAKLEFPGGMGGAKQKPSVGGMDIFWNCRI